MVKILITGGNGFIGSHITDKLLEMNYEVIAFDFLERHDNMPSNYHWFKGDILNPDDIEKACENIDGIIHLAAISRVSDAFANLEKCININLQGTVNLLKLVKKSTKTWFLLGSSMEVDIHKKGDEYIFNTKTNIYSLSKLFSELVTEKFVQDYNIRALTLRFASVYGSKKENQKKVIPTLIRKAINNEEILITNKNMRFNFIYIKDLVEGIINAVDFINKKEKGYYEDLYLCSRETITLNELATLIIKLTESISKKIINENEISVKPIKVDFEKTQKILDFSSKINLNDGIKDTILYIKAMNKKN